MSSPSNRKSILARFCSTALRSRIFGWITCFRLNISNWRVSEAARLEASGVALDDRQNVIKIMRHPGRQLADGLELLSMPELGLQIQHLGLVRPIAMDHVAGNHRKKGPGDRAPVQNDFLAQLFQTGGQ